MEHSSPAWVMLAYLISGVCFILSLRGLSSPATSRRGNMFGIVGMLIAVATTLIHYLPYMTPEPTALNSYHGPDFVAIAEVVAAIALGGAVGWVIARKIKMTDMPQLVAAFHSLVGLAAVLVAAAAFLNPAAFGILGESGLINPVSRVEMGLGVAIGAITFSGSVIAFLKLAG